MKSNVNCTIFIIFLEKNVRGHVCGHLQDCLYGARLCPPSCDLHPPHVNIGDMPLWFTYNLHYQVNVAKRMETFNCNHNIFLYFNLPYNIMLLLFHFPCKYVLILKERVYLWKMLALKSILLKFVKWV